MNNKDHFSKISNLAELKFNEFKIYENEKMELINAELMDRFPSLDADHFQQEIQNYCLVKYGEFYFKGKMISKDNFKSTGVHDTGTTWNCEPITDEFNSYIDFLENLFLNGIDLAIV